MDDKAPTHDSPLRETIFSLRNDAPDVAFAVLPSEEKCEEIGVLLKEKGIAARRSYIPQSDRFVLKFEVTQENSAAYKDMGGVLAVQDALEGFSFQSGPREGVLAYKGDEPEKLKPVLDRMGVRYWKGDRNFRINDQASVKAIELSGGMIESRKALSLLR